MRSSSSQEQVLDRVYRFKCVYYFQGTKRRHNIVRKLFKLFSTMIFLDLIHDYCLRDDYQSLSYRRFTIHGPNLLRFSS